MFSRESNKNVIGFNFFLIKSTLREETRNSGTTTIFFSSPIFQTFIVLGTRHTN